MRRPQGPPPSDQERVQAVTELARRGFERAAAEYDEAYIYPHNYFLSFTPEPESQAPSQCLMCLVGAALFSLPITLPSPTSPIGGYKQQLIDELDVRGIVLDEDELDALEHGFMAADYFATYEQLYDYEAASYVSPYLRHEAFLEAGYQLYYRLIEDGFEPWDSDEPDDGP